VTTTLSLKNDSRQIKSLLINAVCIDVNGAVVSSIFSLASIQHQVFPGFTFEIPEKSGLLGKNASYGSGKRDSKLVSDRGLHSVCVLACELEAEETQTRERKTWAELLSSLPLV
jgi:hypothetical protein